MEQLWDIIKEFGNYGFGFWGLIMFFRTWRFKKAELTRDTVNVYKDIAESSNETLEKLSERNQKQDAKIILLEDRISAFLAVIKRIEECKSYAACPARPVVQDYKSKYFRTPYRQSSMEQKGFRYPRDNPTKSGGADDSGGQPP